MMPPVRSLPPTTSSSEQSQPFRICLSSPFGIVRQIVTDIIMKTDSYSAMGGIWGVLTRTKSYLPAKWIEKSRFLPRGRLTNDQAKNFWHNVMKTLSKLASCSWTKDKEQINVVSNILANSFPCDVLPKNPGIFRVILHCYCFLKLRLFIYKFEIDNL